MTKWRCSAKHAKILADLRRRLAAWRARTNDPLLNPQCLERLKEEIDACFVDEKPDKRQLRLTYPDYFFAAPSGENTPSDGR